MVTADKLKLVWWLEWGSVAGGFEAPLPELGPKAKLRLEPPGGEHPAWWQLYVIGRKARKPRPIAAGTLFVDALRDGQQWVLDWRRG